MTDIKDISFKASYLFSSLRDGSLGMCYPKTKKIKHAMKMCMVIENVSEENIAFNCALEMPQ